MALFVGDAIKRYVHFLCRQRKRTNQASLCELRPDKKKPPMSRFILRFSHQGKTRETRCAQTVTGFYSPAAAMLGAEQKGKSHNIVFSSLRGLVAAIGSADEPHLSLRLSKAVRDSCRSVVDTHARQASVSKSMSASRLTSPAI